MGSVSSRTAIGENRCWAAFLTRIRKGRGFQPRRYNVGWIFEVFRSRRSLLTASCAESGT